MSRMRSPASRNRHASVRRAAGVAIAVIAAPLPARAATGAGATGAGATPQAALPPPPPLPSGPPFAPALRRMPRGHAVALLGEPVRNLDGHEIGRVVDVLIGPHGHPKAAVIEFAGFLGVGTRKIAVAWDALRFAVAGGRLRITVTLDAARLKALPVYSPTASTVPLATAPAAP